MSSPLILIQAVGFVTVALTHSAYTGEEMNIAFSKQVIYPQGTSFE
jgi:hypothetical protein